jgi:hypothetical protein
MLQVGVMTLLPSMLADAHGFTGPQSALVIVFAMVANWGGSMVIVATRLRNVPGIALPIAATASALLGFAIVSGATDAIAAKLTGVMVFAAAIGIANSLVWSLLPSAVPSPEAAGATAGLVTQGSFLGVLVGPPTFFWIRHESPLLVAGLAAVLAVLIVIALIAHSAAGRTGMGSGLRTASSH